MSVRESEPNGSNFELWMGRIITRMSRESEAIQARPHTKLSNFNIVVLSLGSITKAQFLSEETH